MNTAPITAEEVMRHIETLIDATRLTKAQKKDAKFYLEVKEVGHPYSWSKNKMTRVYVGGYGDKRMFSSKVGGQGIKFEAIVEEAVEQAIERTRKSDAYDRAEKNRDANQAIVHRVSKVAPSSMFVSASDKEGKVCISFYHTDFTEAQAIAIAKVLNQGE